MFIIITVMVASFLLVCFMITAFCYPEIIGKMIKFFIVKPIKALTHHSGKSEKVTGSYQTR
jgi:hypothetical protein